jgi:hypothetical protein
MAVQPRFHDIKEAIMEGVDSFKKWYRKVDHTSDAYFICLGNPWNLPILMTLAKLMGGLLVLDPNVKHLYCRSRWEAEHYEAGMKQLEQVVSPSLFGSFFVEILSFALRSFTNTIFPRI